MPADNHNQKSPPSRADSRSILAVVLVYALFAACWILLSDRWVQVIFTDPEKIILASIIKGWLFVAITSWLLYVLMRRWLGGDSPPELDIGGYRRLKWISASFAVVIIGLTAISITRAFQEAERKELSQLQSIASQKTGYIADWLGERQSDADFIKNNGFFAEQYRSWQVSGDQASGQHLKSALEEFRRSQKFNAVSLLVANGDKLWGSETSPLAIAPLLRAEAQQAAKERQIRLIGPYRGLAGHLRLDFIVPLTTIPDPAPPLVVLHIDPESRLFPVLRAWPLASTSAEALLFRREGNQVIYLNTLRHQTGPQALLRLPVSTENLLAARVLRGEIKPGGPPVEGVDYRGVPVVAEIYAIEGSDWFLIAKLDHSELYAMIFSDTDWISVTGMLALLMTGGGFYLLRQRQQLATIQVLHQSQAERLRALSLIEAIAESSDDVIFAQDLQGRFTLFNRAAAAFTGKSAEEVLGKNEYAVFPAELAEKLIAVGQRVIAENRIYTQEEVLETPNGERVCLTTKGPLHDSAHKVVGLFGIARDITERKRAELALIESESRYRALVEQSLAGIYIIQDNRFRYVNPAFASIFGYDSPDQLMDCMAIADLVAPEDRERVATNIRLMLETRASDIVHYSFTGLRRDASRIDVEVHRSVIDYQGRPAVIGLILDISARQAAEEALRRRTDELFQRNDELERFNRASVGRELDMIALKKQVNALCRQLGEQPPYPLDFLEWPPGQAEAEKPS